MAIAQSDGSIIIETKVDDQGLKQGTKNIRSEAAKLAAEYRKAGMSQSDAFKKAWSEIERTTTSTDKAKKSTKEYGEQSQKTGNTASAAFSSVSAVLKKLALTVAAAFSVQKIIQFSNESAKLATQTEASVQRLIDIYGQASKDIGVFIDTNARALGMSKSAATSFSAVYGNLFSVWADQATNAALTTEYLNMTAVVASKTGRTMEDVQERIRSGLLGNTEAVEDLGIFVNVKTIEMTDAFKRLADGRSWEQLDAYEQSQVRTLAILEQSTQKYGNQVGETSALTRSRYQAAYEDFKNTWGRVVNTILLPLMEIATEVLTVFVDIIEAIAGISGKTIDATQLQADKIGEATDNQKAFTSAVSDTNKELKKSLASFDDISILTESNAQSATAGIGAGVTITDNGNVLDGIVTQTDDIRKNSENTLSTWDKFIYEVIGEVAPKKFANLSNAVLMFQDSAGKLSTLYDFDIDEVGLAAKLTDIWAEAVTSALTIASGAMDINFSLFSDDLSFQEAGEGVWQGVGRMIGGLSQIAPDYFSMLLSNTMGVEITSDWFDPITADIENMYGELSAFATKSLIEYQQQFQNLNTNLTRVMWSGQIITPETLSTLQSQLDETFGLVGEYITGKQTSTVESLNTLVSQGYMTEDQAAAIVEKTESAFGGQREKIKANQDAITAILKTASDENRALTTEEKNEINKLLKDSNAESVATYAAGLDDRAQFIEEFMNETDEWDARRLSQTIQLANDLYAERKQEAEAEYNQAIAAANTLYYDLGAITKDEYDEMVRKATEEKDKRIRIAGEERDGIVGEARGMAGEVANAVDSESGVIKSKWEQLWNGLWETVKGKINGIIDTINSFLKGGWSVAFKIADFVPWDLDISKEQIPQIPRLATGAVIPANREFLAVLGDQRQGVNIEAPLETIVDAFNIALGQNGGYGGNTEVVLEIDGREFGRAVVEQGALENRRIGTKLVIV